MSMCFVDVVAQYCAVWESAGSNSLQFTVNRAESQRVPEIMFNYDGRVDTAEFDECAVLVDKEKDKCSS